MWPIKTAPDAPTLGIASPAQRFGADPALSLRVSTPRHCPGYRVPTPVGPVYSAPSGPRCDRPLAVGHSHLQHSHSGRPPAQSRKRRIRIRRAFAMESNQSELLAQKKTRSGLFESRSAWALGVLCPPHSVGLFSIPRGEGSHCDLHASPAYPGSLNRELRLQLFYTRA